MRKIRSIPVRVFLPMGGKSWEGLLNYSCWRIRARRMRMSSNRNSPDFSNNKLRCSDTPTPISHRPQGNPDFIHMWLCESSPKALLGSRFLTKLLFHNHLAVSKSNGNDSALLEDIEGGFERSAQFRGSEKWREVSRNGVEGCGIGSDEILGFGSV